MVAIANALTAYADAAKRLQGATGTLATDGPTAKGGVSFADMLKETGLDSLQQARQSEGLSGASLNGSAELSDVVTAVTNTEVTLQTVLSIRDRVVSSLQEIMRMPI